MSDFDQIPDESGSSMPAGQHQAPSGRRATVPVRRSSMKTQSFQEPQVIQQTQYDVATQTGTVTQTTVTAEDIAAYSRNAGKYGTGSILPVGAGQQGAGSIPPVEDASAYSRSQYGEPPTAPSDGKRRKKGKKKRSLVWRIVLIIAIIVLVISLAGLAVIGGSYLMGSVMYDNVSKEAFGETDVATAVEESIESTGSLASVTLDWDALSAQNPDIVGWVYIPDTNINYPIVQGENDTEYLYKDFAGSNGWIVYKGAIFMAQVNGDIDTDDAVFFFGHNMNDDSMFSQLVNFKDQSYFSTHRTVYIFTPEANYTCMTWAADLVSRNSGDMLQATFADEESKQAFVDARIADSLVSECADVDPMASDKIFACITCGDDYAQTRIVLLSAVVQTDVVGEGTATATGEGDDAETSAKDAVSEGEVS